jgi:hypothetical protein
MKVQYWLDVIQEHFYKGCNVILLNTVSLYKYYDWNNKNQCVMLANDIKVSITDMLQKGARK